MTLRWRSWLNASGPSVLLSVVEGSLAIGLGRRACGGH
jgi:hypothetical protein